LSPRPAQKQVLISYQPIPTLFIDTQLVGTISDPGLRGFDMENEVTFHTMLPPNFVH
jgi:hypothetical protein